MASPNKKSFPLRIDPMLWSEIERMAAQELRSANAQVEYLLRDALMQKGRLKEVNQEKNQEKDQKMKDTTK